MLKRVKIRSYEYGLYFREGEFKGLLAPGRYWMFDPLLKKQVDGFLLVPASARSLT